MKCPRCGEPLVCEDSICMEQSDNSYYDMSYQTCLRCKKAFIVEKRYDLAESRIIEGEEDA